MNTVQKLYIFLLALALAGVSSCDKRSSWMPSRIVIYLFLLPWKNAKPCWTMKP